MIAGAYSLDLYCDNAGGAETFSRDMFGALKDEHGHVWGEFPHQYHHEYGSACRRAARDAGWYIGHRGKALCPKCNPKHKKAS